MRKKLMVLLMVASLSTLLFYEFCVRKEHISGQVFIVTKGSENIKLGLVNVIAIPREKLKYHIDSKRAVIDSEKGKEKVLLEKYSQSLKIENERYESASVFFKKAANMMTDEVIGSGKNYDEIIGNVFSEISNKAKIKESLDNEIDVLYSGIILKNEASYLDYFFKDMDSDIKSLTNADGVFSMDLPAHTDFVICAHSTRALYKGSEEYYWIVSKENIVGSSLILSNNNLMSLDKLDDMMANNSDLIL